MIRVINRDRLTLNLLEILLRNEWFNEGMVLEWFIVFRYLRLCWPPWLA